jgi:PAS domain S-box-containing protein
VSDPQEIERAALEEVLRQMPAAVIVVEAPSGKIVFTNREAQQWTEQVLGQRVPSELGEYRGFQESNNFEMLHPDGRSYEVEEWPLTRSIRSGEEIRDEEMIYLLADGTRLWSRNNSSPIYNDEGRIVAGMAVVYDITEQKRSEEKLAYHAHLLENMQDAVIATDERFLLTAWNKGAEEMYGWKAEEVLGRDFREVVPAEMSEEQLAEAVRVLAERGWYRTETTTYRKDGTSVYVEGITVALQGELEQITGYLNIRRDISERKRAEETLHKSRKRIENVLESVTDEFIALDHEWRFTYVNERGLLSAQGVKGQQLTREDLLGENIWEMFPVHVGSVFYQNYHRAMREQKPIHFEAHSPLTDRWIEAHVYPSEEGLSVYSQDITERKRVEREMETRTRQQAVVAELGLRTLEHNDDLQALMDEAVALVASTLEAEYSKIVELLPGGEELLLRAGVGWREGLVGEAKETAGLGSQAGYTALVANEAVIVENLSTEERFEPPPLLVEHAVVSSMTVVIPGSEGPFGVLGVHTTTHRTFSEDDINFLQAVANVLATAIERKEAQQRLEEVREAERSRIGRDLHDDALQDLSAALVDAQRLKAIFTDPQAARLSERLIATLDRMGPHLRGAIYDLSLEREQDRPFHVLLETMVELHRTMAPHLQMALDIQEGLLEGSLGETGRELLRIIGEALTNTRRHSDATSLWVRVGISHSILFAEVEDDGRGFDPTQEELTSSATGGHGLRAMRERANYLGGTLMTESEPAKGTKVRFELVLHRELDEAEVAVRILLVEDHASIREALASTFEGEGFEVVGQAGSMADARRTLEDTEHPIDVALIDLSLPDGYGADLIKELREAHPQAQALVLSASLDRANTARAVERGAAGVLSKTTHLGEVVDSVRRLRAGETLMPLEEVVELLRYSSSKREEEQEAQQAIEKLTPREIEVLQALALGLDSDGISDKLNIAMRTERNHTASILKKLEVHSQLQALVFALRHGVVEIS